MRFFCLCFCWFTFSCSTVSADAQTHKKDGPIYERNFYWEVRRCNPTNGLRPSVHFGRSDTGWEVFVSYVAQIDFPARAWIKTTNRVGSKLELWQTNGVRIVSTNSDVLAAFHLPKQTTVAEIISHSVYPRHMRGYQWWKTGLPVRAGSGGDTAPFTLGSAFTISMTNDYVLKMSPLLYKVDTNAVNAQLVEFPPVKLKLKSDGHVEEIAGP